MLNTILLIGLSGAIPHVYWGYDTHIIARMIMLLMVL